VLDEHRHELLHGGVPEKLRFLIHRSFDLTIGGSIAVLTAQYVDDAAQLIIEYLLGQFLNRHPRPVSKKPYTCAHAFTATYDRTPSWGAGGAGTFTGASHPAILSGTPRFRVPRR
jgi:hypothetical protein